MDTPRLTRFLSRPLAGWHDGRPDEGLRGGGLSGLLTRLLPWQPPAVPAPTREEPRLLELYPGLTVDRRRLDRLERGAGDTLTAILDGGAVKVSVPEADRTRRALLATFDFVPADGGTLIPLDRIEVAVLTRGRSDSNLHFRAGGKAYDVSGDADGDLARTAGMLKRLEAMPGRLRMGDAVVALPAARSIAANAEGGAEFVIADGTSWNLNGMTPADWRMIAGEPMLVAEGKRRWRGQAGTGLVVAKRLAALPGHVRIASNAHVDPTAVIAVLPRRRGLEVVTAEGRQKIRLSERQCRVALNRLKDDGRLVEIGDALVRPDPAHVLTQSGARLTMASAAGPLRLPVRDKAEAAEIFAAAAHHAGTGPVTVPPQPVFGPGALGDALLIDGALRVDPARLAVIERTAKGLRLDGVTEIGEIETGAQAYDNLVAAIDPSMRRSTVRIRLPEAPAEPRPVAKPYEPRAVPAPAARKAKPAGDAADVSAGMTRERERDPEQERLADYRRRGRIAEMIHEHRMQAETPAADRPVPLEPHARRQELDIEDDAGKAILDAVEQHMANELAAKIGRGEPEANIKRAADAWWMARAEKCDEAVIGTPSLASVLSQFKQDHPGKAREAADHGRDRERSRGMDIDM